MAPIYAPEVLGEAQRRHGPADEPGHPQIWASRHHGALAAAGAALAAAVILRRLR